MSERIQIRRGSSSEWSARNPILLAGELGWDTTTNALKAGDGITRWVSLPYLLQTMSVQLSQATDVEFTSLVTGDLLRYYNGKWRNTNETNLVDGGNY
ncbi:MAG: hypothetical protein EBR82_73665 [Caulobacteraceae bacterium]|nr:hypothetical protein [Caulobacteraceae bacterium]